MKQCTLQRELQTSARLANYLATDSNGSMFTSKVEEHFTRHHFTGLQVHNSSLAGFAKSSTEQWNAAKLHISYTLHLTHQLVLFLKAFSLAES